jgi:uncharacterized phage protein (TIGR02218 family)
MRTLGDALEAHLATGETTLCSCWRVIRSDGVTLGFTDHDGTLQFNGTSFEPASGFDGAEVPDRLGAGVETSEVLGVLSHSAIEEEDILLGRYDGARVETWRVNWTAPTQRVLLRVDTIGEIVRQDNRFRAELRSGQQALNQTRGRLYGALCDAVLGDDRCGVDLTGPSRRANVTVLSVEDAHRLLVSGLTAFDEGAMAFGTCQWSGGKRAGLRDGIVGHQRQASADLLRFAAPIGDWVVAGDTAVATVGCDRRFSTCKARFGNGVNFRGFPHVPGSDYVLRHPRSDDALDGRAVVP